MNMVERTDPNKPLSSCLAEATGCGGMSHVASVTFSSFLVGVGIGVGVGVGVKCAH